MDEAEYLGAGGIAFLAGKWEEKQKKESVCTESEKRRSRVCDYAAEREIAVELGKYLIIIWIRRSF